MESAVLGVPPPYRKRRAGSDEESLPAQTMRPTKRSKVLQQPDAAPTATPRPPLATKDGGIPPQNRRLKRKPPTRSSSGRARAQPTNQRSHLRPPAAVLPTSPPSLKRKSTDGTNPVAGQGRHPAKRKKSQRPIAEAPARDSSRQLRDATHRKEKVASMTRTRRGNTGAVNQAQPKKQAVPEPNYQPKLRRSARIAALPSKDYR